MQNSFSGKFGLKRDLESFPDFTKQGEESVLSLSFYISPMNAKVSPRGESKQSDQNWGENKTIETWRISLIINEDYNFDNEALVNCYLKILKTIFSKTIELPASDFVNTTGKRLTDLQHIFNYQLEVDPTLHKASDETVPSEEGISGVKWNSKSTEFKFDIGFGSIKYEVDYITIKSLGEINEYLSKGFDEEFIEISDLKVVTEYFSERWESVHSSKNSRAEIDGELDTSDEFVLITNSDNFGNPTETGKEEEKTHALQYEIKPSPSKRLTQEDEYKFNADALFQNKFPSSKRKVKNGFAQQEIQRKRLNSDTTACSRVKNILSRMKLQEWGGNEPEVFEKKQFEFKNWISPTFIDNLVINESHFGDESEDNLKQKVEQIANEDFEDEDFNPFDNTIDFVSEMSSSPKYNQGPAFRGLREFRTSIDANDPNNKTFSNTRNCGFTKKHRKFTLSFDGNNKDSQKAGDYFMKLEEGISPAFKNVSFKNADACIKEEEDISFEMDIDDDYFTEDLSDFTPHIDPSLEEEPNQSDEEKIPKRKFKNCWIKNKNAELNSSQFESILYSLQQVVSDSSLNNLNTSDDYCLFFNRIETIRKRLDSRATDVSGDLNNSENKGNQQVSDLSERNKKTQETLLNNYIEIIELKEKWVKRNFNSILN